MPPRAELTNPPSQLECQPSPSCRPGFLAEKVRAT
jgi:hypothetical protein